MWIYCMTTHHFRKCFGWWQIIQVPRSENFWALLQQALYFIFIIFTILYMTVRYLNSNCQFYCSKCIELKLEHNIYIYRIALASFQNSAQRVSQDDNNSLKRACYKCFVKLIPRSWRSVCKKNSVFLDSLEKLYCNNMCFKGNDILKLVIKLN